MDPVWIVLAYLFGLLVSQIGLPPMVGYLVAGFILNSMGAAQGDLLNQIADLGITLLLFSIGLKLDLKSLFKPQVWAVASSHMLIITLFLGLLIYGLGLVGLYFLVDVDLKTSLLLAFALSFSSTVFTVKVLEGKGEMGSLYGKISIGILVMQDLFAVIFLTFSSGEMPSIWSLGLLGLLFAKPLIYQILKRTGHGELLILLGFLLSMGGAFLFELVGLKPGLGALIMGLIVSGHPKSSELSQSLLGFKDLFLVGFFLSIGLSGIPTWENFGIASMLTLLVLVKVVLFFVLLALFNLRSRTSLRASLNLASYSEFGLLVGALSVSYGWLSPDWLINLAISLSLTFVIASPLNNKAHHIYTKFHDWLIKLEKKTRIPEESGFDTSGDEILIVGMGRVGTGAYESLINKYGKKVAGIDFDKRTIKVHKELGRNVALGDITDFDLCESVCDMKYILLCLPNHKENLIAARQLALTGYKGKIAATTKYDDEAKELEKEGVLAAFNIYSEAGAGFAEHINKQFEMVVSDE